MFTIHLFKLVSGRNGSGSRCPAWKLDTDAMADLGIRCERWALSGGWPAVPKDRRNQIKLVNDRRKSQTPFRVLLHRQQLCYAG